MLAGRWGLRSARIYGVLVAMGVMATTWIVSGSVGLDNAAVYLVARGAAILTWVPGSIAALSLAVPPKDMALREGIAALARTRGFDMGSMIRAETAATVVLLGEVIALPTFAIALFVVGIVAGGRLDGGAWPIAGSVVFSLFASAVLGVLASGCRRWGGASGRSWLAGIVLLPWVAAELLVRGRDAELLSIPGLLEQTWSALTAVRS
jgi:hypothetical protein